MLNAFTEKNIMIFVKHDSSSFYLIFTVKPKEFDFFQCIFKVSGNLLLLLFSFTVKLANSPSPFKFRQVKFPRWQPELCSRLRMKNFDFQNCTWLYLYGQPLFREFDFLCMCIPIKKLFLRMIKCVFYRPLVIFSH